LFTKQASEADILANWGRLSPIEKKIYGRTFGVSAAKTAFLDLEEVEAGDVFERVVWERTSVIETAPLDDLGLKATSGLYGVHVGDPDFWFAQLVSDYGREPQAWVIEIKAVAGDGLADDSQYAIPDETGNKAYSRILVTKRPELREGVDFQYMRELDMDDLPEEEDEFFEDGDDFYKEAARRPQYGKPPSQPPPMTQTPSFKAWFGDSKAVDKDGHPLVVYHGSPDLRFLKEDGKFKSRSERYTGEEDPGKAFFFAGDHTVASTYADPLRAWDYQNSEPGVFAAYLKLTNPMIVHAGGKKWRGTAGFVAEAKEKGHDGLIIYNSLDVYNIADKPKLTDVYVVFNSSQIKAANNNSGEFAEGKSVYAAANTLKVYRGVSTVSKKNGPFYTTDPEWARQFTQSGQDHEIIAATISADAVYSPEPLPYGGDPDEIKSHIQEARDNHCKAIRCSEGNGEPDSIYVFDRTALTPNGTYKSAAAVTTRQPVSVPGSDAKQAAAKSFTDRAAFKAWFSDSKVKDAQGKPIVMYHGTAEPFKKVDMSKGAQGLFWLASDRGRIESGEAGASSSKHIMRFYVRITNPAGWDEYNNKFIAELKRDGYDGVILPRGSHRSGVDDPEGFDAIIFRPNQVKIAPEEPGPLA